MPRVLIKESNFDQLQNNLAYTLIIRQHGFVLKQIVVSNDELVDSILIVKIEPQNITKFQMIEKNKEYFLSFEFILPENQQYSFNLISLELPISVLFDKIMKIIDPEYEEKSLLNESTIEQEKSLVIQNNNSLAILIDNLAKKTQNLVSKPVIGGIKLIQGGMKSLDKTVRTGLNTILSPFNQKEKISNKEIDYREFLTKELILDEYLLQVNKIHFNHIDSALKKDKLENNAKNTIQSELLFASKELEDPTEVAKNTIVFFHPFTLDWTIWKPYITYFQNKNYRVLAFDLRGWGASEQQKNDDYKFTSYYNDILAILREKRLLENENELILALGSLTGLMFLHKVDESILKRKNIKLLLFSVPERIDKEIQEIIKKLPHPRTWGPFKKAGRKKIKKMLFTEEVEEEIKESLLTKLYESDNRVIMETIKNLEGKEYVQGLNQKQIEKLAFEKILILTGGKDILLPITNVKYLEQIKNTTIKVIEDGNHLIAFERPEIVIKEIDMWL
jgi:hypothetical protein